MHFTVSQHTSSMSVRVILYLYLISTTKNGFVAFQCTHSKADLILDIFSNINDSMILYVKGNKHEVGCSFMGNTWGEGWRRQRILLYMNTDSAVERMHKNTNLTRRIRPQFCSQCLFCGKQIYGYLHLKISP